MRLNWIGWGLVVSSMRVAANVLAVGGDDPFGDPKNGLSSEAFRSNALTTNTEALDILRTKPLNNELFQVRDGYIGKQLRDPHARAVMEELVECALDASKTLTYVDPEDPSTEHVWRGQLGLCQTSETGDWSRAAPTEACQQLVTACIMARVNALGKAIPLSLRGQPSSAFPLVKEASTVPVYREGLPGEDPSEGTLISSFGSGCDLDGDCRWHAAHVGTCTPGDTIQLALEGPPGSDSTQLRVCSGIHGCPGPSESRPGVAPDPPYSQYLTQSSAALRGSSGAIPLTFPCPGGSHVAGYYSVMFRGIPPTPAPVIKKISGSGTYPASEQQVFTFLEGAFFGNLFESADLAQSCKMDDNKKKCGPGRAYPKVKEREKLVLPYTNVHACYSFTQDADSQNGATGVAYLNSRLCALPGADCFFHPPRPCEGAKSAHCQWVGSEGVYRNCKNPSDPTKAFRPITTYLNEPCDLVDQGSADNQELCGKLRALPRGRRPSDKPSSSCGGCSRSCSAGGQLQLLAGAAILALILRRRRRRG